jgi:hypothetical protein
MVFSTLKRLVWSKAETVLNDEPIYVTNVILSENKEGEREDKSEGEDKSESESDSDDKSEDKSEDKSDGEDESEDERESESDDKSDEDNNAEDQTVTRDHSTFMDDFYMDIFTSPRFRLLCNLYAVLVLLSISATTYNLLSSTTLPSSCEEQSRYDGPSVIYIVFVNPPNSE